ncbi:amidohydrolase [Ekhidna sp. To15]|uniref:amidohydrolase n=1 Tax=Ekhidna sp. To15 TaxID=3395267 RepID=UPI003F51DF36
MRFLKAILIISIIYSCQPSEPEVVADTIFYNGPIYTMDDSNPTVEAVAIKADTFLFVGTRIGAEAFKGATTSVIDLAGKTMIPGLTEGHAHIMGVGYNLLNVDLREAKSYQEVVEMVAERAAITPEGTWILGRGWHQDKWTEKPEMTKGFPTHDLLSEVVPNHPVWLKHASGHAALGNAKAMEVAGINSDSPQPDGGEIFMSISGQPTGIFNETAQGLITQAIPSQTKESDEQALKLALKQCFEYGITGFHQAGSGMKDISLYKEFAERGDLKLRLYVMLNGRDQDLLNTYFQNGIEEDLFNNQLTVRSVKLYADGALGSRGAWLLEEYSDAPGVHGHNVMPMEEIESITADAYKAGFQVCVHAIGDRANREVLDIYERTFSLYPESAPKEPRFRIEHAQHFHPDDIPRFAEMGVIPAMQAIHMSSDRPWAIDRLGKQRIEWGAYMWQTLLQSGAHIVNGTDAPVEPITPLASFYASVSRRTLAGNPEGGYEPAEKMTREQALKSYTLDAAYAAFREDRKGSIEAGKWADLTVFDKDIMTIPEEEILNTTVEMTIIAGEIVYKK